MNWIKMFAIFGVVSEWFARAIQDGIIDEQEMLELVTKILSIANVKAQIKIDTD